MSAKWEREAQQVKAALGYKLHTKLSGLGCLNGSLGLLLFKAMKSPDFFISTLIDPSTVFSSFDKDRLFNFQEHCWKEHLSKLAKFKGDTFESSKYIAPQSRKILQTLVWWVAQTCLNAFTPDTTVLRWYFQSLVKS